MRPVLVLLFLCLTRLAYVQSLGEVAKKEKERRQKLTASKVLTETDLKSAKGETLSVTGAEVSPTEEKKPSYNREAAASAEAAAKSAEWAKIRSSYSLRYGRVKEGIRQAQQRLADCKTKLQHPSTYKVWNCNPEMSWIKKLEVELRQIENELADEARRRRVLPRDARLPD